MKCSWTRKGAGGKSLLWRMARRGPVDDFRALLRCLNEHLADEHVGNTLTSLFKTFVTEPCALSVVVLTRD